MEKLVKKLLKPIIDEWEAMDDPSNGDILSETWAGDLDGALAVVEQDLLALFGQPGEELEPLREFADKYERWCNEKLNIAMKNKSATELQGLLAECEVRVAALRDCKALSEEATRILGEHVQQQDAETAELEALVAEWMAHAKTHEGWGDKHLMLKSMKHADELKAIIDKRKGDDNGQDHS